MGQSEVPFYLAPHTESEEFWLEGITNPTNGTLSPVDMKAKTEKSFWEELSEVPSEAGAFVYNAVSGSWNAVKDASSSVFSGVTTVVDAAGNRVGAAFDFLTGKIILLFVVLVGGLYVIAKSGLLKQAAAFA